MGREEHCKQTSLACVGSARSVWATLGLPQLMVHVLSHSTLLRLQVVLQGHCPKQALRFMHWRRKWQPTPMFLHGESQGQGSLASCRLWGRIESDTTEATYQQQQQIWRKV